ncbi:MAG: hypothetical protein H7840_06635, partial [Alphaproteobacteria bacterium]
MVRNRRIHIEAELIGIHSLLADLEPRVADMHARLAAATAGRPWSESLKMNRHHDQKKPSPPSSGGRGLGEG